jgi:hypothetical protein
MGEWRHGGGWSVDASVRVADWDRQALERLVSYCARPPLASGRLGRLNAGTLVYRQAVPGARCALPKRARRGRLTGVHAASLRADYPAPSPAAGPPIRARQWLAVDADGGAATPRHMIWLESSGSRSSAVPEAPPRLHSTHSRQDLAFRERAGAPASSFMSTSSPRSLAQQ